MPNADRGPKGPYDRWLLVMATITAAADVIIAMYQVWPHHV